jgi:hypothetical protein
VRVSIGCRQLSNYQELKEVIAAVCDFNHDLMDLEQPRQGLQEAA